MKINSFSLGGGDFSPEQFFRKSTPPLASTPKTPPPKGESRAPQVDNVNFQESAKTGPDAPWYERDSSYSENLDKQARAIAEAKIELGLLKIATKLAKVPK